MRIIAGTHKGRQIKAVTGDNTRPTTDKVKENIFNVMGQFFAGGMALDLFAGSGNLGLEAISRGVDRAVFIDMSPAAIKVINGNIANLNLGSQVEVYRNDAMRALGVLAKKSRQFDLIFLDPPYAKIRITNLLSEILNKELIRSDGIIMCEFDAGQNVEFDEDEFGVLKREVYGTIEILILQKN